MHCDATFESFGTRWTINRKKVGRIRWNYLDHVPIQEIYDRWISKYAQPSLEKLTRWKNELESIID